MEIGYLPDAQRVAAYNQIMSGCKHLWSKNQLQMEKFKPIAELFGHLAEKDPRFLAHLTSYVVTKLEDKDMQVMSVLASTLSDANGMPFERGSEFCKPNWRTVGQAGFLKLDPKLACRVLELSGEKFKFGSKPEASHQSKPLRSAAVAYLRYREKNLRFLEGAVKNGFTTTFQRMYRALHVAPSADAARVLRWKQKPGYPGHAADIGASIYSFDGMTEIEIANYIILAKLSPLTALGALKSKVTPPIAAALLEVSTPNQAVILTELFEKEGLFQHKEIVDSFEKKVATASALDRIDRKKDPNASAVAGVLKAAKAEKRKDDMRAGGFSGKVFVHIDVSSSMYSALEFAKNYGSVIAECIPDPANNFRWGIFNHLGATLPQPKKFTSDEFKSLLYAISPGGSTNCLSLWKESRAFGADVDIFITDQGHNQGSVASIIQHGRGYGADPSKVVIVHCQSSEGRVLGPSLQAEGIDVSVIEAGTLTESALVTQALLSAFKGTNAFVDMIMATPMLELPKWWDAIR